MKLKNSYCYHSSNSNCGPCIGLVCEEIEILQIIQDWSLQLVGAKNEMVSHIEYESGVICFGEKWTIENGQVCKSMPLWLLAGRVDNVLSNQMESRFNRSSIYLGYTIQLMSGERYTIEFDSQRVAEYPHMIFANVAYRQYLPELHWPLKIVDSDVNEAEMFRNVKIPLVFED